MSAYRYWRWSVDTVFLKIKWRGTPFGAPSTTIRRDLVMTDRVYLQRQFRNRSAFSETRATALTELRSCRRLTACRGRTNGDHFAFV